MSIHRIIIELTAYDPVHLFKNEYVMVQAPFIWLIDDDDFTVDIIARAFKKEQLACQLKAFVDSRSLLTEIRQTQALPHLLMTDYDMPGMNGLELIERLKSDISTHQLKIVLFSRHMTADIRQKAVELNVYQVENKPAGFGEWRSLVKALCEAGYMA